MHSVLKEIMQLPASVYLSTLEIHMLHVDQSVWSTQIVLQSKHVRGTNVLTLALEHVVLMHSVEC